MHFFSLLSALHPLYFLVLGRISLCDHKRTSRNSQGYIPDRIGNQDEVSSAGQQKQQMPTIHAEVYVREFKLQTTKSLTR